MQVSDFAWSTSSQIRGLPKPADPHIRFSYMQKFPPVGGFAVFVEAWITLDEPGPNRLFRCAVEVEASEHKAGMLNAIKAVLIQECLARWDG